MSDLKEKRSQMIKGMQDSLRIVRQVIDLSAQELGEYIGVSRQTINNIETKKTPLNAAQYISIAALLDREVSKSNIELDTIKAVLKAHSEGSNDEVIQLKNDSFTEGWFGSYEELRVETGMIKSKVLDELDLTTLCENYKIFFTNDIFENDAIESFIFKLMPYLTDANTNILMPDVATNIIENKVYSSDPEVANKAKKALNVLVSLEKAGLLSVRGDDQERDVEEIILDVCTRHRNAYNMVLFTQNQTLAEKVLAINDIKTDETLPIMVCTINEDGNAERKLLEGEEDALNALRKLLLVEDPEPVEERNVDSYISEDVDVERVAEWSALDGSKEEREEVIEEAPKVFRPIQSIKGWDL